MRPTAEHLGVRNGASDDRRKHFVEAKVQQKTQQSALALQECERLLKYIHRLGVPLPGSRLLDLGCGTGRLTAEFAEKGYDAYGIDVNADFIKVAREKVSTRGVSAQFMTAPAEQLPFDDNFFDVCIAINLLEHVADWKKTVNEVSRILKPGGIALFETGNALYPIPGEVKYVPCLGYVPHKLRKRIIDMIAARFPRLVSYSLTPAQYWFTHTGLRKALSIVGFKQSWDIFDLTSRQEVPPKFWFASWLLPMIKKLPYPYIRDIAHFPRASVMLISQKA